MKPKIIKTFILLTISTLTFAQSVTFLPDGAKITNNAANGKILMSDAQGNASWQLNSSNAAIPFVTTTQRLGMTALSIGMEVFDTDFNTLMMYDGSDWRAYSTKNSATSSLNTKIGNDTQFFDKFGYSVAIRGDVAVIGASQNNLTGAVYIFKRINNNWTQQQKLVPDANEYGFGENVAICDSLIAIKANKANAPNVIYIFKLSNSGYEPLGKISPDAAPFLDASLSFGNTIRFSKLLGYYTLMIGSYESNNSRGAVYEIIARTSDNLSLIFSKIIAPDAVDFDRFGSSLEITPDQQLIVGASSKNSGTGKVYFFNRNANNTWNPAPYQTIAGATNANFGQSMFLNNGQLAIGSPNYLSGDGKIDFYAFNGTQWATSLNTLLSSSNSERLGSTIAMGGNYLITGNFMSYKTYKLSNTTWAFKTDGNLRGIELNAQKAVGINSDGRFVVGQEKNNVFNAVFGISEN